MFYIQLVEGTSSVTLDYGLYDLSDSFVVDHRWSSTLKRTPSLRTDRSEVKGLTKRRRV